MNQQERVLEYIVTYGSITTMECVKHLDIVDLQGVVRNLKQSGHNIQSKWIPSVNKFGKKIKFKEYSLGGKI